MKKDSIAITYPELVKEWNYEKNYPLTPSDVTAGSGRKVWWICDKGHSYEASIAHRSWGTSCPFCSGQKVLSGFNDLKTLKPDLASEWNYVKNSGLKDKNGIDIDSPEKVSTSSGQKVWWKCKNGHEWQAAIYSRASGTGCPICSGNQVLAGYNDFETINPKAARNWDYEKNIGILPNMVKPNSKKVVWWKCDKGHEWKASVSSQNQNINDCPYCANKTVMPGFNDLFTRYPNLKSEWDYEKNTNLNPSMLLAGSNRSAWWKCKEGHTWKAPVYRRVEGAQCPYCTGRLAISGKTDLVSTNPELAREWNYEKNKPLLLENVKEGTNKKVWWKCKKGHEWQAAVNSRSFFKLGCPFCSNKRILVGFNDLATVAPQLAAEWNYSRNGKLKPTEVVSGSGKTVWWICERGHEWKATIGDRYNGNGCPYCSNAGSSMPEQAIAFYLSQAFDIEQRKKISDKEVDIYLPQYNIGIEYDGAYYHKNLSKDLAKERVLKEAGLSFIRISENTKNCVTEDGHICFNADDMGTNYEWAVKELLKLLTKITGNDVFTSLDINIKRDRLKIRERYSLTQKENSIAAYYPELVKQWNYDKNGTLKPEMFSRGSNEKVWWKCDKGHEWQASISNRIKGKGCPICVRRIIISGVNDLATVNPELSKEWNYRKNGEMIPSAIAPNARFNAWWICSKCGGEYQSWVYNRAKGVGCPYCSSSSKKVLKGYNDLASNYPGLIEEWNYSRNNDIIPDAVAPGSNKKVWWKCKLGHEWEASIVHRVNGRGCPYCAGKRILKGFNDLETINPLLAKEWDFDKNEGLTPDAVSPNSNKKVWWKCANGHEWSAIIHNRNKGVGCPICYKDRKHKKQ